MRPLLVGLLLSSSLFPRQASDSPAWTPLFDGRTMAGWRSTDFGGEGTVAVADGRIVLGMGSPLSGVTYTGDVPRTNYEIELSAIKLEGNDFFCGLTFPVNDAHLSLIVGGWAGATVGISSLDGLDASENETRSIRKFDRDRWYTIRVRVTTERVEAWIDEERVVSVALRGRRIGIRPEVAASRPLGIASYLTRAGLREIRLRRLDGSAVVRPAILGIDHAAFKVRDLAAADRFYGTVLGLPSSPGAMTPPSHVFHLSRRQRIVVEGDLAPEGDERLSHVAFATSDLTALSAYLRAKGIAADGPRTHGCSERALRARDPDGHLIEFVEEPIAAIPARAADAPAPLSSRLLHAGVTIRDETAAHTFWRDVLGFSEIWRGGREEGRTDWVNMRLPESTDYIEYMLVSGPVSRQQLGVLHHACLLVPDIQSAWEAARARTPASSVPVLRPPSVGRNQRWQLNLYDAEGTRIELMEPFTMR
jgi:catechol 2,3-dioxygenase-like lactoylglutathione lyase family enzyme